MTILTPQQIEHARDLQAMGLTVASIARALGFARSTIRKAMAHAQD